MAPPPRWQVLPGQHWAPHTDDHVLAAIPRACSGRTESRSEGTSVHHTDTELPSQVWTGNAGSCRSALSGRACRSSESILGSRAFGSFAVLEPAGYVLRAINGNGDQPTAQMPAARRRPRVCFPLEEARASLTFPQRPGGSGTADTQCGPRNSSNRSATRAGSRWASVFSRCL